MTPSRASALVREAGGDELVERLAHLDRGRGVAPERVEVDAPDEGSAPDFDVLLAGGGLSILYAPILASLGLRVAVVDRSRAGAAHREWNASRPELAPLIEAGLFTERELDDELVIARYASGLCRWHGGGTYAVRGVLDHAVDAGRLLERARARALSLAATILDETAVVGHASGTATIAVALRERGGAVRTTTARVLVDARGASSPYARADLVCPTVGGVMSGLDEGAGERRMDPSVGEILATTEGIDGGRQHVWEAFPGRPGETTVYLFHYAKTESVGPGELTSLYARFFERLPSYKGGDARLVRPTFGFIPGWSRLGAPPTAPSGRIVLVGDAAARHSPLTFCGFGATLRSLIPTSRRIARAVESSGALEGCFVHDAALHTGTGALAMLLASPPRGGHAQALNELLDTAFASLSRLGEPAFAALLRDEMSLADFLEFLRGTARRRPRVYADVVRRLGLRSTARWGASLARAAIAGA